MLKKTLLTLGVLAVAGTASAEDITNPFYLARKMQLGSITSVGLEESIVKNSGVRLIQSNRVIAREDLQFGLTDSLAIIGGIGNTWDKWKNPGETSEKDNENIMWDAGMAWNILSGPAKWQVSGIYGQNRLENFDGEYKFVKAETKLGYQFQRLLPYVTGSVEIPVAQKKKGDKFTYNAKAGIYQGKCEVWALDTGIRLMYDENTEARYVSAEAEASYYLTPKTTIGVYGSYMLDGRMKTRKIDPDGDWLGNTHVYDRAAGLRLRMFF